MTYPVACSFCGAPAEQRLDPGKCGVLARCEGCSGRRWTLIEADVLDALREMPNASFDALLSDVPYGLGSREPTAEEIVAYVRGEAGLDLGKDFMSKDWQIPPVAVWREVYRVLKPGAPLLVFAGTRTQDLISIGMRAAGFEIRDGIVDWVYASGFPKSLDVSKAIDAAAGAKREVVGLKSDPRYLSPRTNSPNHMDRARGVDGGHGASSAAAQVTSPATEDAARWSGYGTALKPAREPVIVARKPLDGTVAHNAITHGVGGLNVDGCRIGTADSLGGGAEVRRVRSAADPFGRPWMDDDEAQVTAAARQREKVAHAEALGRWPANLVLTHLDECRRVGTRRVRTNVATNGDGTDGHVFNFGNKRGAAPRGHADADGLETVEAWDCAPGCPVAEMDRQSGNRPGMSGGGVHRDGYGGGMFGGIDSAGTARGDSGGASRFFATFQVTEAERCELATIVEAVTSRGTSGTATAPTDAPASPRRVPEDSADESRSVAVSAASRVATTPATGACSARASAQRRDRSRSGPSAGSAESPCGLCATATAQSDAATQPDQGQGSQHGAASTNDRSRPTRSRSRVSSAAHLASIGITSTTASQSESSGCASSTIVNTTTSAVGAAIGTDLSTFRFVSKASRSEREFGCEHLPARKGHEAVDREEGSAGLGPRAGAGRTADEIRNIGPCVKPIKLTRYLATLALPPPRADGQPRRILIPYAGTGSEMIGALRAGWDEIVGIQRTTTPDEAAYAQIARARLERWEQVAAHLDEADAVREAEDPEDAARAGQLPLLAGGQR